MKRLTYRLRNQLDEPTDRIVMTSDYTYIEPEKKMETVLHRLAAIEDILGDEYDLDRLKEAVKLIDKLERK